MEPEAICIDKSDAMGHEKGDFGNNTQMKRRFVEMCVREVNAFGYQGRSLKPTSWDTIRDEIIEEFGLSFKQKDLKNKWDYLRRSYRAWRYLVNKGGDAYNAENGTFSWPQSVWDDIIRQYPSTKKFKNKPLEYENEMRTLFEGTLTNGDIVGGPPRKKSSNLLLQITPLDDPQSEQESIPTQAPSSEPVMDSNSPSICFEDAQVKVLMSTPVSEQGIQSDVGTSQSSGKRKRKLSSESIDLKAEVRDLIALIKDQVLSGKAKNGPSLDDCMQVMNVLLQEGKIDMRIHCGALLKFCECDNYMKAFMGIQAVEHKVFFLRTMVGDA
ncbi:hypothetical protein ACHQM5_006981 [Ranunculus cassubicifolius]